MKDKMDSNEFDKDVEDLLCPKCDFHVSPGFKDRVMHEARTMKDIPVRKQSPWKWGWSVAAAASVIAAIMLSAVYFTDRMSDDNHILAAKETTSASDSTAQKTETPLLAERTVNKKQTSQKTTKRKSSKKRKTSKLKRHTPIEEATDQSQTIIKGELPMGESESSLEPEDIRKRLVERQRNEDIAFIDRMRDEISANEEFITQLLASENFEYIDN